MIFCYLNKIHVSTLNTHKKKLPKNKKTTNKGHMITLLKRRCRRWMSFRRFSPLFSNPDVNISRDSLGFLVKNSARDDAQQLELFAFNLNVERKVFDRSMEKWYEPYIYQSMNGSLGVQRSLKEWVSTKDHYFSRDLQSTIPGDYNFNGL